MKKKRCGNPQHDVLLPLSSFGKNSHRKDGLQKICLECKRSYDNLHYLKSKKRRKSVEKTRTTKKEEAKRIVYEYLKNNPCEDCGEDRPYVLEFDHKRPSNKKRNIADMVVNGLSEKSIMKEIKKCRVLCANCHRARTAKQRSFYSYSYYMSGD